MGDSACLVHRRSGPVAIIDLVCGLQGTGSKKCADFELLSLDSSDVSRYVCCVCGIFFEDR